MRGGGVLEVLLVGATGLKRANLLGRPNVYAVMECGDQVFRSKATRGKHGKVWWNEKFVFELLASQEGRKHSRLRLKIMEMDKFTDDSLVGEARIQLDSVLWEGQVAGNVELKPAPYNVVLPCGRYRGEIKVGLKFHSHDDEARREQGEGRDRSSAAVVVAAGKAPKSVYRAVLDLALGRLPAPWSWPRLYFFHTPGAGAGAVGNCKGK